MFHKLSRDWWTHEQKMISQRPWILTKLAHAFNRGKSKVLIRTPTPEITSSWQAHAMLYLHHYRTVLASQATVLWWDNPVLQKLTAGVFGVGWMIKGYAFNPELLHVPKWKRSPSFKEPYKVQAVQKLGVRGGNPLHCNSCWLPPFSFIRASCRDAKKEREKKRRSSKAERLRPLPPSPWVGTFTSIGGKSKSYPL